MDKMLMDEIEKAIEEGQIDGAFVGVEEGNKLIEDLASRFSFDLAKRFIWEREGVSHFYDYGNNSDWEDLLMKFLEVFGASVYICISNEEFYPWRVLLCKKEDCLKFLTSVPFFEYFIFDEMMRNVLFDTHDNSMVVFGM